MAWEAIFNFQQPYFIGNAIYARTWRDQTSRSLSMDPFTLFLQGLDYNTTVAGQKYLHLRDALIYWFAHRVTYGSPEDLADRTLDAAVARYARGIENFDGNLIAYCHGIARNILLEHRRKSQANVPLDEIPAQIDIRQARKLEQLKLERATQEERLACLRHCLTKLAPTERALLQAYYNENWAKQVAQRKILAQKLNITLTGLRSRAHRLRDQLEICVRHCLQRGIR